MKRKSVPQFNFIKFSAFSFYTLPLQWADEAKNISAASFSMTKLPADIPAIRAPSLKKFSVCCPTKLEYFSGVILLNCGSVRIKLRIE